jgi:glucokinase
MGIDVGGTFTKFGFIDRDGACLADSSIPTHAEKPAEDLFERLFKQSNLIFQKISDKHKLVGIGIGAPNANYYKGTVELPPNLNWGVVDIVALVKKRYNIPVAITNDANAAAIGEMKFGAAKGMKDFIVITLGTGLGSGIVANGNLIYGADGFAGEIGHTIYDPNGRQCGCGRKGCLETYASASGIKRTVFELLCNSTEESILRKINFTDLDAKMISDAANAGDKIALEAFDFTAKVLGLKLADSVAHLSPQAIILFGGLAAAGKLLFEPFKKYFEESLLPIFRNKVQILPSGLKSGNSAVLGAAALIWNELDKK